MFAALVSGLAFLSVLASTTPPAGSAAAGWPSASLFYVIYRKGFEGTTLTKRVSVTEQALTKQVPELAYRNILVPVFGTKLDDDIVSTAGRLAAAEQEDAGGDGEAPPRPHLRPRGAADAAARRAAAARAGARRRQGAGARQRGRRRVRGREVSSELMRARNVGAGIVEAARRSGAEAIVDRRRAAEQDQGRRLLGGIGAARPAEIGAATEYVLKKAPCRVLLTAPPEALPDDPEPDTPAPAPSAAE